ncbi:phosphotransferase enzyme family protein [Streptomyces sp. BE133]|uniref:phosphotransferase enzyme family protein n=1 Tax=Streptomyces sp. BE133 TaxID=3002523 RepID=UPI002E79A13B|nr:phosphotransferase [Streptomyces sp. BE133]MEE1805030.1 phosphotransferase [Streptomyces sp. BE133]
MRPDLQAGIGAVAGLVPLTYAIVPCEVRQGPAGTDTRNYVVRDTEDRRWFVKVYRPGTDVTAEQRALEASEFAGRAGVPVARVQRTLSGGLVASRGGLSLSVSVYVEEAQTAEGGLRGERWPVVGEVVGRLHRGLARHPAGSPRLVPAAQVVDVSVARRRLHELIARYEARPPRTGFAQWALEAAHERLAALPGLAAMLEALPQQMTAQVVHGDLSTPNLLLRQGRVAAVIDFRPPGLRSPVWELGRLASDPRTVLGDPSWPDGLARAVSAYRAANPTLSDADLRAVVRVAAGYLGCSVYPLAEPLDDPAAVSPSLEAYAYARHQTVAVLREHLEEAEEVLRDVLA